MHTGQDFDPIQLLQVQLELECIRVTPDGLLKRIPCQAPDTLPKVYAVRHYDGFIRYLDAALPQAVRDEIQSQPAERTFNEHASVITLLDACGLRPTVVERFSTYRFIHPPAPEEAPQVIRHPEFFEVQVDGTPVSRAWSSRENEKAAEVAVETRPEYRQKGYARQVVCAWARQILLQGKIAFYSHRQSNLPSRLLAQSLGVQRVADLVVYE